MENASKALIIAGAIILAVLIIGIGMSVFMQASNSTGDSDLTEYEITQFNQKFIAYEGTISGSKAMALCDTVRTHNGQNSDDPTRQVLVTTEANDITADDAYGTATEDDSDEKFKSAINAKASLKSGKSYNVTFQYDKNTQLIIKVNIKDKSK